MADVFIEYVAADSARAKGLAAALRHSGWSVRERGFLPGHSFLDLMEGELASTHRVLILWSRTAEKSSWKLASLENAVNRGAFIVLIDEQPIRSSVGAILPQFNLKEWGGDPGDPEFQRLSHKIGQWITATPEPAVSDRAAAVTAATSPRAPVRAVATSSVFLCYRREDTQDAALHLAEKLTDAYGRDRVFMDIDSGPLGIDFVEYVSGQISKCSAVIVMIGKQWLTMKDKKRRRRLDNEDDLVRAEIAAALKQKVPVIPVIVQNASMPSTDDLPDDIRLPARRNGIHLRPEQWREGVERLLNELDRVMGRNE